MASDGPWKLSDDREIAKQIWEGKIPIVFTLAPNEVTSDETPEPYYILAPRSSYLPLVTERVRKHFQPLIPDCEDEMWLDYAGQPLKWHYPIGVLFDSLGSPSQLPWALTVHFQGFPDDELLHCPDKDTVEAFFVSLIKEADYLKNGSTKRIMGLQKKEQKELWMGLKNAKFEQFWKINKRLMQREDNQHIRNVPFRIYLPDGTVIQEPFAPVAPDGTERTLGDLMKAILPDIFGEGVATQGEQQQVIIHGISPSFETPLEWLSEHCSHPDNFLHLCIRTMESPV